MSGADVARCFIALVVDEETARAAVRAQRELPDRGVSLASPESMHVTLKFLGDVDTAEVARPAFDALAPHVVGAPIALGSAALEAFPSAARASVLVLALPDEGGRIARLAGVADQEAGARGVPREERRFRPHLTLGRCRRSLDARELVARVGPVALGVAPEVTLFRSDREARGVRYTPLATVAFMTDPRPNNG